MKIRWLGRQDQQFFQAQTRGCSIVVTISLWTRRKNHRPQRLRRPIEMRLFVELLIAAGLIYFCWEKPFAQRIDEVSGGRFTFGKPTPTQAPAPVVRATPTPSGAWMN